MKVYDERQYKGRKRHRGPSLGDVLLLFVGKLGDELAFAKNRLVMALFMRLISNRHASHRAVILSALLFG
jgi:hypothetical protein